MCINIEAGVCGASMVSHATRRSRGTLEPGMSRISLQARSGSDRCGPRPATCSIKGQKWSMVVMAVCGCVGGGAKGDEGVWLFMDKNLNLGLKMAGNTGQGQETWEAGLHYKGWSSGPLAAPPQTQGSPGTWPVVCSSSGHGGCHVGRGVGCGNCP